MHYYYSSSSSANRGPDTRPYGLRSIPRQIGADTVSVHVSGLPSASASEVPVESLTTESSLPLLSGPLATDPPFSNKETALESVSEMVFDCQDDSADEPTATTAIIQKKKRPRKAPKRKRVQSRKIGSSTKKRRKKSEPELAAEFSIPDYQAIAPILGKLGFETRDERYYLPSQCWVGKEEVEGVAFFLSTEKLRQDLCRQGIPNSTTALTDEEMDLLRTWVRYSIADRYFDDPQKCPSMIIMKPLEAQKMVTKLGAVCSSSSYQWYAEKEKPPYDTWHEFEDFLAREGLSSLGSWSGSVWTSKTASTLPRVSDEKQQATDSPVLLKIELLRLAVFLADNKRIKLL
jgi:hypothetical protein